MRSATSIVVLVSLAACAGDEGPVDTIPPEILSFTVTPPVVVQGEAF